MPEDVQVVAVIVVVVVSQLKLIFCEIKNTNDGIKKALTHNSTFNNDTLNKHFQG